MYSIVDSCLLCLTSNKSLKRILSQDSHGVLIEEKIKYFLFEFENIDPEITKHICLDCLENLNHVCNIKQLCLRNVAKFNSYIHILKTVEEPCRNLQVEVIQNDTKNLKKNQVDTENESHSEMIENFNFESVFVKTETSEDGAEMENVLEDDHTEKTEVDEEILRKEYNVAEYVIKENEERINVNEFFPTSNTILWNTDEGPHKKLFLHKHIDKTVGKLYKCEVCEKEFTCHKSLVRHKVTHTGVKAHKCDVCGMGKLYKCEVCEKEFKCHKTLVRHKVIHTGVKAHKCDVCGKAFSRSDNLAVHKLIDTGVKAYKCEVCGKAFTDPSSLIGHKLIHTGVKAYKCDVCDKAFTYASSLRVHQRLHTGAKPYACAVCGKAFNQKYSLTNHKRIHSGEM